MALIGGRAGARGPPVREREGELEAVIRGLERAAGGAGACLLIGGEAGIGKTRLVGETLALAGKLGVQVWAAGSHELERNRPFGALSRSANAAATRRPWCRCSPAAKASKPT